jgi:hypothetical protein
MRTTNPKFEALQYINTKAMTPHQARELNKMGYRTYFVHFLNQDQALYDVYVKLY